MGDGNGFWQALIPEKLPSYCGHCYRQGHEEGLCHVKHPELRPSKAQLKPKTFAVSEVLGTEGRLSSPRKGHSRDGVVVVGVEGDAVQPEVGGQGLEGAGLDTVMLQSVAATECLEVERSDASRPAEVGTLPGEVRDGDGFLQQYGLSAAALVEGVVEAAADSIIHTLADQVIQEPEEVFEEADTAALGCENGGLAAPILVDQVWVEVGDQQGAMVANLNLSPRKASMETGSALGVSQQGLEGLRDSGNWHMVVSRRDRKKGGSPPPYFLRPQS